MTHRHRTRVSLLAMALAAGAFLAAWPASPSGFQIMTQGARATGMGLAFTAVADDPTAIFYNPAGLGWLSTREVEIGASLLTRTSADFNGRNPYPGPVTEHLQNQSFLLPNLYTVLPISKDVNFGLGVFAPYGLGVRWENPETWSGRFISQNAVIQSIDINPVVSWRLCSAVALAFGADLRFSRVTLERNQAAINPFTNSAVDVAHIKLNGDLTDNHAWGWNAGIMVKPDDVWSFGVSYRSRVKMDFAEDAKFTQRPTGNAQFDAVVASQLPLGMHPATATLEFPSSVNIGVAVRLLQGKLIVSGDADWTEWSTFRSLDINFPTLPTLGIHRPTLWKDSWAYRGGVEYKITKGWAVRAGYYYDNTPQPGFDAGPILPDNSRNVYSAGFGYNTERWGVDVGDLYLKFKDRHTPAVNTDNFYGTYKESANVAAINFRLAF